MISLNPTNLPQKKRILVPIYSQSDQLKRIVENLVAPLRAEFDVVLMPVRALKPYPFPWPFFRFLDVFPESIYQIAPRIEPLPITAQDEFDLIILPYQVWYLSPSLPIQALLQDPSFRRIAKGKPVITVIDCRNMWHMAQEKVKAALQSMGARLLDNVVLTDQGGTFATFITVPRWLWTGKHNAFWGLPPAGVHPEDIKGTRRFGLALRDALLQDKEKADQPMLAGLRAVVAQPKLLVSERTGTRSFMVWGKLVRAAGAPGARARLPILFLYVVFLITLIITVVPISIFVQLLLRPLLRAKMAKAKTYFELPSGSGKERLQQYE